jgi:hypothetical protein
MDTKLNADLTESALVSRINRALAKNGEGVRRCRRQSRWFHDLGRFYLVDVDRNAILRHDIGLEALGRELQVMLPYEELEATEQQ